MVEIPLNDGVNKYSSSNVETAQVAGFYDGYYAVALTGGFRPKYSDNTQKVRFTAVLVACNEKGEINKDFAQVLEVGSNLSKIIYTGALLSVKSSSDYVKKWQFDETFGKSTPTFTFGMVVKITSKLQNGFVKPFNFDARKELEPDAKGNYIIREDMKALHSVFTFHKTNVVASWATPGKDKECVGGFYSKEAKESIEKHINAFFEQQVEFANKQNNSKTE